MGQKTHPLFRHPIGPGFETILGIEFIFRGSKMCFSGEKGLKMCSGGKNGKRLWIVFRIDPESKEFGR